MTTSADVPTKDSVNLSQETADALDALGFVGYVGVCNVDLPTMAWLTFVLKEVKDEARTFPRGKWATIQHIEEQLTEAAKEEIRRSTLVCRGCSLKHCQECNPSPPKEA